MTTGDTLTCELKVRIFIDIPLIHVLNGVWLQNWYELKTGMWTAVGRNNDFPYRFKSDAVERLEEKNESVGMECRNGRRGEARKETGRTVSCIQEDALVKTDIGKTPVMRDKMSLIEMIYSFFNKNV